MEAERWLITGAAGVLGGHLLAGLAGEPSRPAVIALLRSGGRPLGNATSSARVRSVVVELAQPGAAARVVDAERPTHVIHAAAVTAVSDAHRDPARARAVNADASGELAQAARRVGARLVYVSTDMVFDGARAPYREGDAPNPLSEYGRSKAAGEQAAAAAGAIVARVPLMYGFPCTQRPSTFAAQIQALRTHSPLSLFVDEYRTPIWLPDAARGLILVAGCRDLSGIVHISGPERLSRYEMIARCARLLGIESPAIVPVPRDSVAAPEPRPADLSLDGSRFVSRFPEHAPRALGPDALAVPGGDVRGLV